MKGSECGSKRFRKQEGLEVWSWEGYDQNCTMKGLKCKQKLGEVGGPREEG